MGRAGLEKNPQQVAAMFDGVAGRYDRTNTLLSFAALAGRAPPIEKPG